MGKLCCPWGRRNLWGYLLLYPKLRSWVFCHPLGYTMRQQKFGH
jgi:hypothetical protein